MRPMFIHSGSRPESALGLLWLLGWLRFFFFLRFGLGRFCEFHCGSEKRRKESAAQEGVPKELPRLGIARRPFGQRNEQSVQRFGVLQIVKRIKEPRRRVRDEVKQNRPEHSATRQF